MLGRRLDSYQLEAVRELISQLIVLHSSSQAHNNQAVSLRLRLLRFVFQPNPVTRCVTNLYRAAVDLEVVFRSATPTVPMRLYENTTINHAATAYLGDYTVYNSNTIYAGNHGADLRQLSARDHAVQLLSSSQSYDQNRSLLSKCAQEYCVRDCG